jgi:hypothetical protein
MITATQLIPSFLTFSHISEGVSDVLPSITHCFTLIFHKAFHFCHLEALPWVSMYKAVPQLCRCFWLNTNYTEESWTKLVGTSGNASDFCRVQILAWTVS